MFDKSESDQLKKQIEKFKQDVIRTVPLLVNVDLSEGEWLSLKKNVEKRQTQRNSSIILLTLICDIKGITRKQLDELLKSSSHQEIRPRTVKIQAKPVATSSKKNPVEKEKNREEAINTNPLIVPDTPSKSTGLIARLSRLGVKKVHPSNLQPASPDPRHPQLERTPGGTRYRPFFYIYGRRLLLAAVSPKKPPAKIPTRIEVAEKFPKMVLEHPLEVEFTVTRESLEEHNSRRPSQNTLQGGACRDVFSIHDPSVKEDKSKKRDFNWCHFVALTLGGSNKKNGLFPATASSNLNALDLELYVRDKIKKHNIPEIKVKVKLIQPEDAAIPNKVEYHLSWIKNGELKSECTIIDPQSHRRDTSAVRDAINLMREYMLRMQNDEQDLGLLNLPDDEADQTPTSP